MMITTFIYLYNLDILSCLSCSKNTQKRENF